MFIRQIFSEEYTQFTCGTIISIANRHLNTTIKYTVYLKKTLNENII